jgi:hypothetical protein
MKKITILLAFIVLILASLACQTLLGGGNNNFESPNLPEITEVPQGNGNDSQIPLTTPPVAGGDGITVGGESEFPATRDAFNVVSTSESLTFQTKMSTDDVLKFYRDEFTKAGYKEDASMALLFGKTFTLVFTGHASGKSIYVIGADAGDGSLYVSISLG